MRVATISGYALPSPIRPPQDHSLHGGTRRLLKRDVVLVVAESADGTRDIATMGADSSAVRRYFGGGSQGTFADVVNGAVTDTLRGEPIEEVKDAHAILRDTDLSDRLRHKTISTLDVALYDIRGKQVDAPIYKLLAGGYGTGPTTEMSLYMSTGVYMEPKGYTEQTATIRDLGFFGYKYRPGIGPDGDRRTIELLSNVAGEMEVMLDVHTWWRIRGGYNRETVEDLVTFVAERDCYWVEEPVSPDDHAGYVNLAATGAPLADGESEPIPDGLIAFGETGAVAFLQGGVYRHCGYTDCHPAVEPCIGHDVGFVPYNFGVQVGLLANAHLAAAASEVSLLEYPASEDSPLLDAKTDPGIYPFDLTFDTIEDQPAVEDGVLSLSSKPGLRVEVSFDALDDYPFHDGPWTEFHYNKD